VYCNDLYLEDYRNQSQQSTEFEKKRSVARALKRFKTLHREIRPSVARLADSIGNNVSISFSLAKSYIDLADTKYKNDDLKMAVAYLESALSAMHEMVDASMPKSTVIAK